MLVCTLLNPFQLIPTLDLNILRKKDFWGTFIINTNQLSILLHENSHAFVVVQFIKKDWGPFLICVLGLDVLTWRAP